MESNLTLSVVSPLLCYGATSTAISVAGIGGGIAAAAYGLYKGAAWFAASSESEVKTATNIADECSAKANKVFSDNKHTIKYANRKSAVHNKSSTAFDDEEAVLICLI